MNLDALRATRPIRTNVETPDEINQVFDAIAYQKTAAVIRMVEGYVGAASFRDGINAYVKKFAFANATGEGFWTTLAAVTKKPVDRILSSYITQSSMPLVTIKTRCSGGTTELSMSQRPLSAAVPASTMWDIPVCYKRERAGKAAPAACVLLSAGTQTAKLDGCSTWLFANADSRGYYRTSYESQQLRALGEAVVSGQLTPHEQTTLFEDLWTLVRLDRQGIAEYLSLSSQLVTSQPSPAIATVLRRINYVSEWLVEEPRQPAFRSWVRQAVRPLLHRLGRTPKAGEAEELQELRSAALFTMGNAGRDPEVLREARRLADLHLSDASRLHPSLVEATLQIAAIEGDTGLYEQVPVAHDQKRESWRTASVPDGAVLLRGSRSAEAYARVRVIVEYPHAGRTNTHPVPYAASVGQCRNVGTSQEQLGRSRAVTRNLPGHHGRGPIASISL